MIPFTPDERRAQFAPSQNVGGAIDRDVLDIIGMQPQPTMAQQVEYEVPEVKPVDPDVLDIVNQAQMPMMASLMGASRVNPDQAAEAKRLGSQIGIGQDIALRNLEDVRKRAFMADVQRRDIARANPVLAGFLSDPTFANEASDDIEPLSRFERTMDYIADIGQYALDLPSEFGAGFRTGQVLVEAGMLGSTAQLRGRATEDEIQKWNQYQAELQTLSGDVGFWRQTGETLGQLTRSGEEAVKGGVAGGVAGAGAALLAGQLGPQMFLPEEVVTVPAATLFGVGAGIASSFATTSARTMAGNNYMKNVQSGMDPDVARVTALGVGAIGGALELFGAKLVAAPFKGLWSKVVSDAANDALVQPTVAKAVANAGLQYSKAVGGEIGTEVSQQITEIAFDEIAGYASDPNFESRFATPEGRLGIRDELKDIIVRTALGMSVLGGIGPGANLYVDTRRAGKAVRSQQAIQSVVEAVNAANLKRRDPDALEAFGNAALRETPAFIRGTTMRQILDANKVSNAELDAIVPGLSTKIQEAVDADNFVSLPLAQFGVRLAGTKVGDAMVPHLTVDPTAMTPAELEAFNANVQEFTALAAAEYEAKTEAESAFVQEADQVATTMRERLIAAGRDPALAEVESLVHQAFVVTQAARQGKTPAQFEAESGLREIVGVEMPAAPLEQANRDIIARVDAELGGIMDAAKEASRAAGKTRSKDTQAAAFKAKQEWIAANPARYEDYQAAQRMEALENERVREAAASALAGKIDESLATAAKILTDTGFVLDYESLAPSKSKYYRKGNTLIRLSDHEIPVTPERAAAREAGVQVPYRDFVFDGTDVDAELLQELETRAKRAAPGVMEQASRIDADYMAAVERGDMDTAQRMVDDAANAAGYKLRAFHGTDAEPFTVFGNYEAYNFGDAAYFSPNEQYARIYAESHRTGRGQPRVLNVALRVENTFSPETNADHLKLYRKWTKEAKRLQRHSVFQVWGPLAEPYGENKVRNLVNWEDQWWLVEKIREAGFDSFTTSESDGETIAYGILNPNQIKLADAITRDEAGNIVPLSRRFDITSPRIFEQAQVPAAFYSALGRAIDAIDIKSASAAGWKERIKGLVNKGDIKQDELTWSGLEDWLSLPREGKITKEEVAEFLKNNGVRVERVAMGASPADLLELRNALARAEDAHDAARAREDAADRGDDEAEALAATEAANQTLRAVVRAELALKGAEKTKYAQYTLPGGTNYREVLLTLPVDMNKEAAERDRRAASLIADRDALQTAINQSVNRDERAELERRLRNTNTLIDLVLKEQPEAGERTAFTSQHWTQPNVVAHLRMNDRVDADGKRVLFVEEVQSDWGQAGVKRGFVNQRAADEAELADLSKQQEASPTDARKKQIARIQERLTKDEYNISRAPYVETTDGWLNLGLKQIMLEAVRGGYDRVAFVNGEQSADRYDLSNQVDSIVYRKTKDGNYDIEAIKDSSVLLTKKAQSPNDLEGVLGKDVAKRIVDGIGEQPADYPAEYKELSGVDLKVGGEGMKSFYDTIVPAAVNKLLKKYGGGKIGQIAITESNAEVGKQVGGGWNVYVDGLLDTDRPTFRTEAEALASINLQQPSFDVTDTMREKIAPGLPLFQAMPGRGPARGGYDPSRLKILFGKGADFTTGAHELTHYYVDYYTKQALAGTAAPQMLADLDIMFKFMGVAGATPEERLAAFNAMPFETARPLIETITYNAEIYLFEGKAPSLELAGVFDRMLAFFRRAYKSIADFVTQQRDIYRAEFGRELPELSDELRQVFDRMLADERQIKQAQAVSQMRGQFTVKPEGMDDAEWAAYQEMAGEATNAAIADMTKASLRQMEWLSRARSRIIKDMQARHTAQRKEVRELVQREVQQDPLYRAMAFLRRGQVVAPDGTVTEAEGVHRIDRVLAAEFAPTVDPARLGGRFGVLQDDGLHPDIVAEMFGFPAGASLLQALADAKPMREVVEDRTDAEMLRLYGEMNTPEAREQEIQKALHNEARARLVGVELRFMGKIQQPVRVLMEAARQAAKQVIDRKIVRDIRPSEFVAAEAKASREATAAMQENKPDAAVRAKRAQLLNNQLAKAALEARDEIDNGVRYLRRVLRDSNRQRMGADVADQIASLLDRFNIAPMTADEARRVGTLAEFLATLADRGLVPDIAESIGMRDTRIPYKNMTIAEFRDLVDAVKQLEYIGKNERKILLAKEKAEFESVRDQIVASVIENAGDRKANARTATTNIGRAVTAMKGFAAAHLKAASIVRILDGGKDGGPLWNYLIRSANEAGDSETSMRAEATADLTKILEPVFRAGKLGGKGVFFPTINRSLNREARLVVALNMGNAGNMQRLLDGEGWSIEAVMPVLQSLTEDELNTVQQIWDYFEKYRPMIGQKERRLYGKEPAWVDPQPLVVRSADGKTVTLRGGYYPIKYDPRASLRAETMSEADEAKRDLAGAYTTATTRRSFVKSRVRKVEGRPLLYTLAGMYGGINDVIHDLTWHEWLIQANRLMRSNSFDDAVRNRYGPEYVAQLKNWIKDVAAGERGVQNEAEMALNFLRQGISSAGLGFNIVSAAMQITGFNQSIVRVGAKWIGRGIAYTVTNPMLAMQEVNEKSEFMRNRSRTQFRELNEIRNMVQGQSIAMRRVQMGTYFLMMRMQRMVDVPTWHGAYEKAMHEGRAEETAIALADQAVIDSQGGGMVKDLARVERGGPAVKLFTVFYGYMNTVYNMAAVQTMTNKNKGRLAADYAMLFVVPVVLSYMLKQALIPRKGDEEEEWDMGKIGRELAAEQLSYLMGTMVIAREFGEVGKMIFGVEGPRMGYGGPAGLRAIGETYQFATQASQGEFDTAFRKSAVNMIGAFTGLPSAQVNRTLDGLEALYEGETQNVLAPLTGAKKR